MSEARLYRAPWEENAHARERSRQRFRREMLHGSETVFDTIRRSGPNVVKRSFPRSCCAET